MCDGGPQMTQPYTAQGYWVKVVESYQGTPTQRRGAKEVLAGFPFPATGNASDHFAADFDLPMIFFECLDPDACLSNNT